MKKIFLSLAALALTTAAFSQLQVNPQIGMNFMTLSDPPEGTNFSTSVGYSVGVDLRFGERFQFQPGVHWFQTATAVETSTQEIEVSEDLIKQFIKLKAMVAYNLIDNGAFKLRINAGPAYDFLVNVDEKDEFFDQDDFKNGIFYAQGGVGVDILFLSAEVGYAQGLTQSFDFEDSPDSRMSGFYFTVGVVFGDGKN